MAQPTHLAAAGPTAVAAPATGVRESPPSTSAGFEFGGLRQALAALDPQAQASVLAQIQRSAGNQSAQALLGGPVVQRCTRHSVCPDCAARAEAAGQGQPVVQADWLADANAAGAAQMAALSATGRAALHVLSCIPLVRALAIVGSAGEAALQLLVQHTKALTMPSAAEAQILLPVVEKALITSVCNCLPDSIVTSIALHVYLIGQPLAQRHLEHYLTGAGADFPEDINDLFTRNPTIRNNVASQVAEQADGGKIKSGVLAGGADLPGGGQAPGFPPITQDDYDDQDWRNSIGNVDRLEWTIVSGPDAAGNATVRITLADPYAWHPKEARLTQCVHQAIENMKSKGAKEYMARGTGDVVLNLGSAFKPGPNAGPR